MARGKKRKRLDGEGTIYKVKNGIRAGTWIGQLTVAGKRKSFYGRTQGEVRDKMDDYKDKMGVGLDVETARQVTFGEWLTNWLELYKRPNVRLSTYELYIGYAERRVLPALGHIALAELTADHIQRFYNQLQKEGLSPSTINKMHLIISPSLDKAAAPENRIIAYNPARGTKRPVIGKSKSAAMSKEDMSKFLGLVDQQEDKWRAAFLTLIGTGLRIGELLALEWNDIDMNEGTISVTKSLSRTKAKGLTVERPKTEASAAMVPVPEFVLQAIRRHRASQAAWILQQGEKYGNRKLAFPSNRGTYMLPRNFQRKHDALIEKAGVERVSVHGLRHTFATRLLEQGESIKVVQELLRHTNISTTGNIYSHVSATVKKKAAQKMDSLLRKDPI